MGFKKISCDQELANVGCLPFARSLLDIYSEDGLVCVESVGGDNLLFMNTLNYFAYPHH